MRPLDAREKFTIDLGDARSSRGKETRRWESLHYERGDRFAKPPGRTYDGGGTASRDTAAF
jgi:hypothetical protein